MLDRSIGELESKRAQLVEELARVERGIDMRLALLAEMRGEQPPSKPRRGRIDNARSRLVQRVLGEAKEPLSRVVIQAALEGLGHEAELDDISSTLTYLRRQGLVAREGGNRWVLSRHD